jgi:outer membrane protein assembly factor BamE (lipoprotein component of BamABCDE complex)
MSAAQEIQQMTGRRAARIAASAAALGAMLALAACSPTQVMVHGAIVSQDQIDLIPVGSSRDQVLLALGSPSTTGSFESMETYYYISQKRQRTFAYQKAKVVDQRVLAVYFDEAGTVTRVADYGLKDGKVFDFITRTTPTGGRDLNFLGQILAGPGSGAKKGPITPLPGGGVGGGGPKI